MRPLRKLPGRAALIRRKQWIFTWLEEIQANTQMKWSAPQKTRPASSGVSPHAPLEIALYVTSCSKCRYFHRLVRHRRMNYCRRMRARLEWYNTRKKLAKRASGRSKSMSMYPQAIGSIPEETVRIARAACPKGTLAMRLRDTLAELYQDEQFAALYPVEGQPVYARWRLAIVTVLQYVEGL